MDNQAMFTNSKLAQEAERNFGSDRVVTKTVEMNFLQEANNYINKINDAHERAKNSKIVFK